MYQEQYSDQMRFENFYLPFGGKLSGNNRWVLLAELIPWDKIEKLYSKNFSNNKMGAPAKSARVAVAALIIQERLSLTDEETVAQIQENPYLQYFIGHKEYRTEAPFDATLLVYFRKRINSKIIAEINEELILLQKEKESKKNEKKDKDKGGGGDKNSGKLIVDATCVPNDIRYPTDISLLNESREKCEEIIDVLHEPLIGKEEKLRTYRQKAREEYLKIAKKRKHTIKELRKGIGKQLNYIKRDLGHITKMVEQSSLMLLNKQQYKNLLVIQEVYRQQEYMYREKTNHISGRIVSITQPHIRPMVRGKAGAKVEFGSKISISIINGYTYLDRLSWEPYNEGEDLKRQVENYKKRFGVYPASVHVDTIYRTKENQIYCQGLNIRMSGRALGRSKQMLEEEEIKVLKKQTKEDFIYRIAVEGKIGQGKRRFGMNRIMTKLSVTSETVISMIILIMNLEKVMRGGLFFVQFFRRIFLYFYVAHPRKAQLITGTI